MAVQVSPLPAELDIKMTNILQIEKMLNDSSYRELIEFSSNFNTRLCLERKLRLPFIDPQTGVAQRHSTLHLKKSQRMPGLKEGQIYSYPSLRWRCKKSSSKFTNRPFYRFRAADSCANMGTASHSLEAGASNSLNSTLTSVDGDVNDFQALIDAESNSLGAASNTDSKDSQNLKDESLSKDWFYDDMDANDIGSEEQADSDFEYSVNGYKRKRKPVSTRKSSRKPKDQVSDSFKSSFKSRSSSGTSSRSNTNRSSRKSSSRPSTKTSKSETVNRNFPLVEPPSFADVEPFQGSLNGAYRSF